MPEIAVKRVSNRTPNRDPAENRPKGVIIRKGSWYVRREIPTLETYSNGKTKYLQIVRRCDPETAERAQEILAEIDAEVRAVRLAKNAPVTVQSFFERFLAAKQRSVSERTYEMNLDIYDRFIKHSAFAKGEISLVTTLDVQEFYDQLSDVRHASADTVRRVHLLLTQAFDQAVVWDLCDKNRTKGTIRPKVAKPEISLMNEQEARRFLAACREDLDAAVFEFALETYMRPEEYLALRVSDVDLDRRVVYVTRKVTRSAKGGGFKFKEVKTRTSRRSIEISPELARRLRHHLARREEWISYLEAKRDAPLQKNRTTEGPRYWKRYFHRERVTETLANLAREDLLFPSSTGLPMAEINLNRREFAELVELAGLSGRGLSLYSLRHTGITLSLAAGVGVKTVSEKAGHASVKITLDTYAQVLPSMRDDSLQRLRSVLY